MYLQGITNWWYTCIYKIDIDVYICTGPLSIYMDIDIYPKHSNTYQIDDLDVYQYTFILV